MVYKYVYINKKTYQKVYSNEKIDDPELELVKELKGGPIKQDKIIKK